ncbi:apoptosis-inducing factor homolog A-like [Glycine max]|uniref:apoptosis-inducing factor homolog A-like n=1 Tax=Glycine max TaxID=3847 RepID=UPI001B356DF6|nr:apoptosis-inducing factor homolog A-like [Glycine max]
MSYQMIFNKHDIRVCYYKHCNEIITNAYEKWDTLYMCTGFNKKSPYPLVVLQTGKPLASAWLKETVLKNDLDGQRRIKVDERLRVKGWNNIFAIGDVTDIPEIKQGFLAQQ